MPFCRSCGAQIPADAAFCPSCGTAVAMQSYSTGPQVQNEFDRLTRDSKTQEHWFRRLIAYVIDWIIVLIAAAIITGIAALITGVAGLLLTSNPASFFFPFGPFYGGIIGLEALLLLLYFTLMEATYQKTVGKSLMGLKVKTLNGEPVNLEKSFIRNLSKIYWLLLLLDVVIGLFEQVTPGQKFSDKFANTIVVSSR